MLLRRSGFSTYPRSGDDAVPHYLVALLELASIGGLPIVVPAKERLVVGMPTSASIGEYAGRWFASSRLTPIH
ncbi:hypothetical protein GW17_00060796, partial [Ensete ventricosum]